MSIDKAVAIAADISTRPEFEHLNSPTVLRIVQETLKAFQPPLSRIEALEIARASAKRHNEHAYTNADHFTPHNWVIQAVADATMRYSGIRAPCNTCGLSRPHHGDPDNIHLHLCDVCNNVVDY